MRASKCVVVLILMMVALAVPAIAEDPPVTTTRDARGVWFIEGGSLYDVYEAMGYAVAKDRLFQLDLFRRQGDGRLSELLGPSQLQTDIGLRMFSYSDDELTQQYNNLSADAKTAVQAYVAGINRRIGEFYRGAWMQMPHEYWILSFQSVFLDHAGAVLPTMWTVNDLLGWVVTLSRFFDPEGDFASNNFGQLDNYILLQTLAAVYPTEYLAMFTDLRWVNDPGALTYIQSGSSSAEAAQSAQLKALSVSSLPDLSGIVDRLRTRADNLNRSLEELNARVRMGSYAWAVSGDKTATGNPIVYSGPQMGFETPSIVVEGSIRGGGLEVSGMTVPGVPGIIIGRTPHHAWSMQVGHAHTLDYYLEAPQSVSLHRMETIKVLNGSDVTFPIFRSPHGPIVEPFPYDPNNPPPVIVSWAYAHWGREASPIDAFLGLARAESIAEFDVGIEKIAVSQHFCYADRDGNIAYWMSGYDPIRAPGVDPRFPQIGDGTNEWTGARRPRIHESTPRRATSAAGTTRHRSTTSTRPTTTPTTSARPTGRTSSTSTCRPRRADLRRGPRPRPQHRHHRQLRQRRQHLVLRGRRLQGRGGGGPLDDRTAAIAMLDAVGRSLRRRRSVSVAHRSLPRRRLGAAGRVDQGGPAPDLRGRVHDGGSQLRRPAEDPQLQRAAARPRRTRCLDSDLLQLVPGQADSGKPDTPAGIIVQALDNVIDSIGLGSYNVARGEIVYRHPIFGVFWQDAVLEPFHLRPLRGVRQQRPGADREHVPARRVGRVLLHGTFTPTIDPHMFSMAPVFDPFMPRPFPLFD